MIITPDNSNIMPDTPSLLLPNKYYSAWVDGSYLDKNRNKAGVGIIITPSDAPKEPVLALAYNLSNLKIRQSKYTELWAATLAMEEMKDFKLKSLTFDSPITQHRIQGLRDNDFNEERVYKEWDEFPQLYERLSKIIGHHPDMELRHRKRSKEHMPDADKFSRISATRRIARVFSHANQMDIPCLYNIVGENGKVRDIRFYDRMESYDVPEYITGAYQAEDYPDPKVLEPDS